MADNSKEKALQARVSADFAKRFNLVARARGKSTSELVREAVERLMADAEGDLEKLRADLRRKYHDEQRALGLIPDDEIDHHAAAAPLTPASPPAVSAPPVPAGAHATYSSTTSPQDSYALTPGTMPAANSSLLPSETTQAAPDRVSDH